MEQGRTGGERPKAGEAPFGHDEIFFSRSEQRGLVLAGNEVFRRVAHYSWADLIGAPHRVVRHPDMPQGFFQMFWDRLKNGRMVSGYVKNLAADGLHYWVYAVVTPLNDGGYLSVRIKPCSQVFEPVRQIYVELRQREREEGLTPPDSARAFLHLIRDLGHADYSQFMAASIAAEMTARDRKLGRMPDARGAHFRQGAEAMEEAGAHTAALRETFRALEAVPHNMRILAARLEASGGPLAAISNNYGAMSAEISDWVNQFLSGEGSAFVSLRNSLGHSRLLNATAALMEEARRQFEQEAEGPDCPVDIGHERQRLEAVSRHFQSQANRHLATVEREAVVFGRAVSEMKRMIAGLSTTRMMCKIESARLAEPNESLIAIIRQLDGFQRQLEERLERISAITSGMLATARALEASLQDERARRLAGAPVAP